ncbi:MAG: hypothetical protein RBR34_08080, partial [Rhodospirillaceae bacterium]|nr:hypothetical protein [Rhodospirillaceae bacterium]
MKRTPERQTHSDNKGGFRFPLLVALWSLVLLLGGISAPAMATTFSFANGSGSDAITSASSAGWTENGETLRFAVSGLSGYYPFACDGLLGVAGDAYCLSTGGWAVRSLSSGSATIRVTVSITGKVFDLTSLVLTDGGASSVGSYSITT